MNRTLKATRRATPLLPRTSRAMADFPSTLTAELQTFASALAPSIQARLPLLAAPLAPGRLYEAPVKHWPMEH